MNYKGQNKIIYQDDSITKILIQSKKHGDLEVIIDTEDYDKIKTYRWYVGYDNKAQRFQRIYADTLVDGKQKLISLHHFITGFKYCDHKNLSIFDNRKNNLRECNHAENARNSKIRKDNKYGYKGIGQNKNKKWYAYIKVDCKKIHLGYFNEKIEAAIAYNEAAIKYFGEFACLNQI